jgi:hypothetical protein
MANLEEDKLHAEIAKLHAETKNLNAAAEKDLKEGQKASEEALKLKIDSKNALRGMGYWWIEGLKIFAAAILGLGGLMAAISGYTLGNAEKVKAEWETEKARSDAAEIQKSVDGKKADLEAIKKRYEEQLKRLVVRDYALGSSIVKMDQINAILQKRKKTLVDAQGQSPDAAASAVSDAIKSFEKAQAESGVKISQATDENTKDVRSIAHDLEINLFSPDATIRNAAYALLIANYRTDQEIVNELLELARADPTNRGGRFNVVATLLNISPSITRPKKAEISRFLDDAQNDGGQAKEYFNFLRQILAE